MGGQVGMGGMGGMGPQFGDQGAPMWRGGLAPMGQQMGGPGGNPGYQNQIHWLSPPRNGAGQGGQQWGPQMGADGNMYQPRAPSGPPGMLSQYPGMAKPPPLGNRPMPDINDPSKWSAPNMFTDPSQGRPPPQGMGGMLGGIQGGCPPWMPGCQGGGGYGGGFAASMPMYGGSRPTLQAQLPAQQTPPPPPRGGTTVGYSDAKLKQDVEPLEDGLELVNQLDPVRFSWIGSDAQTTGMIAQQVEEVLPGAVVDMGDGYKGIDGLAVIGALVGAIKTLTTRLEALEAS